ncbi:NAD(P)H-dependent glycerol-3-phosphate dehydrogenase [Litoribrevibacter albus]|uniref:Glycerol-3-phosphate dehydrogenase [NAD(P)+] n=1 Tax=Litoribrevibacter albus TaxID=1473156 RepID=A0AA37W687_9GAMM|nr:NAD(P)H-dependent glycerol-3-phosphate dehydrogenase [Litoribrevibacter albus]GLQ30073.1 glycerol-3-phosphate dehydrogenase [NAD(P)+] [Litoribrevibacter albus]
MTESVKIAVLGGGSFGTAIANIAAENGHQVFQWMRSQETVDEILVTRQNQRYMPDYHLNENLIPTTDLKLAVENAEVVFVSIPSKSFRSVVTQIRPYTNDSQFFVSTTKGIEVESFKLMSQIIQEELVTDQVGVLSGPNLAKEIAKRHLTASVIASSNDEKCQLVQKLLSNDYFRVYASHDNYGVELGGALKNIYAIISGLAAALGLGENTKSMLITRSLAEMSRFAVQLGANPMTFLGLSGVGDLIVTCMSPLSRNYRVGFAIGKGKNLEQAVDELGEVAEGINTLKIVYDKAEEMGVYMPLVSGLYQVLYKGETVKDVARSLMLGAHKQDVEFAVKDGDE